MWVRGLKHCIYVSVSVLVSVAPRVGAWIETLKVNKLAYNVKSHPVWVRGLKQPLQSKVSAEEKSHPVWVRGLKQFECVKEIFKKKSHPVWVRGLKPNYSDHNNPYECRTPCGCVD